MSRIESLLSARLFIRPQLVRDRLFFMSNLSGHLSLYAMDFGGSVPEPLLPPHIALQNPHLMEGYSYYIFPKLEKILVMIDNDGNEKYQPMWIPFNGGFPEAAFASIFADQRTHLILCDREQNMAYLSVELQKEQMNETYKIDLVSGEMVKLGASPWGAYPAAHNQNHDKAILVDGYTLGDQVLYLNGDGQSQNKLLYGVPLEKRSEGQEIPLLGLSALEFAQSGKGLLMVCAIFSDTYSLAYLNLETLDGLKPVEVEGARHTGVGEMESLSHVVNNVYLVRYNIDGCSWLYEGVFNEDTCRMTLERVICGEGSLSNGVLESVSHDKASDAYALSFSTATSPTQIYTVERANAYASAIHTRERVLGIPQDHLSQGEDASFTSFDGTRMSARLYLPAEELGFDGPRPLVYYVHGGPQGQERPDFAWFSMPLIQFLTLNGFAVFVPNVRGSTGYGLQYTKQVDRDWGGKDRLDHVHAMTKSLPLDQRLDTSKAAVVGRSYGGYMTLTLAARHPELWSAAVDMFGPYDLFTFMERIPETWKPYFAIAVGDPDKDRDFLVDRSPRTHIENIQCPLLVIQGKNDPRVVEQESRDLVEYLRSQGKEVDYLMFENEGHDVLKFENRVTCYNAITDFFRKHLL